MKKSIFLFSWPLKAYSSKKYKGHNMLKMKTILCAF